MTATAVVVVSYNTRPLLRRCLASVMAAGASRIVVVDNGSTDGSPELVEAEYPTVTLIRDPSNPGFGAAANRALERCTEPYALVLNADTELAGGALASLAAHLDARPRCGLAGPRIVGPDGRLQPSAFHYPTPIHVLLSETPLGPVLRRLPLLGRWYLRAWSHDRTRRVPWVRGAALALRMAAMEEVGGFDPGYRMYFEETDLCLRLARAGWDVELAPVAEVVHVGGASTAQHPWAMQRLYYESLRRFYDRHYGPPRRRALEGVLRVTRGPRLAAWSVALALPLPSGWRRRLKERRAAERQLLGGGRPDRP